MTVNELNKIAKMYDMNISFFKTNYEVKPLKGAK
jgi:hypothetical protein